MEQYNALKRNVMEKFFSRMNPMQREAVFQTEGSLLLLAGAGSGKTTVVVNRIANLLLFGNAYHTEDRPCTPEDARLLEGYLQGEEVPVEELSRVICKEAPKPWNILAITFTNKAANELKERLSAKLGEAAEDICAATFHSACVRILRRDISNLGYDRSFTIYDTDDQKRLIKECMKELDISNKNFPEKMVLGAISRAKDSLQGPVEFEQTAANDFRLKTIARVYHLYQQKLKKANALDFDDIIVKTVELFEQFPDVLAYYRRRFRYITVDEYQDTNHAQYRLIALLAAEHQNICVVGDDDQSIYKFRGATIENILSFEKQYRNCKVIRLEQNYRSTQTILNAANGVICHNTERKGKNLWTENPEGDPITLYLAEDEGGESEYVADVITENVAKGAKYGDHAILYRMNAQSNSMERRFVRAGIPYKIVGGTRFYDRKEVKDLLSYLAVLNNPMDTVRLRRIINEPKRKIGEATVDALAAIADGLGCTWLEVMRDAKQYGPLSRAAGPLEAFAKMMDELTAEMDLLPLDELGREVLEKTGYLQMLKALGEEGETRLENAQELISSLATYQQENEDAQLSGFLEEVALMSELDSLSEGEDKVVMMTIHSAKGLEFPTVFLIGMENGIFPGFQSMFEQAEMQEERRLAYVAITRAKKELYLTRAKQRMLFGQTQRNQPSRFSEEIPTEYIKELRQTPNLSFTPGFASSFAGETREISSRSSYSGGFSTERKSGYSGLSASGGDHRNIGTSKPSASSAGVSYSVGEMVSHKVFGEGMILSASPMGNDTLLEIAFDKVGTKKLMANFAKLKKV
ncbi:MAG: UvrD-helicase domain-containing protein [Oscillospiraceae bacterium]|nr:UvrD-helicase domain-containing protein [Oscillospiraceae bacterium]